MKVLISNWLLNSKISQLETLKLLEVLVTSQIFGTVKKGPSSSSTIYLLYQKDLSVLNSLSKIRYILKEIAPEFGTQNDVTICCIPPQCVYCLVCVASHEIT